jgi:hypothetical protein
MWYAMRLSGSSGDTDRIPELTKQIDFSWGVKIPMRDGIKLNAGE